MALSANAATGVQFAPVSREMLECAIDRTYELWCQPAVWRCMQQRGMRSDVSWDGPARAYAALFRALARAGA
jgi:starch synthase